MQLMLNSPCSATSSLLPSRVTPSRPQRTPLICQSLQTKSSDLDSRRFQVDSRRNILLAGLAVLGANAMLAGPSFAEWDGSSAAYGSCPLGEEGVACRSKILARDIGKKNAETYGDAVREVPRPTSEVYGIPVADLNDVYVKDTLNLSESILQFGELDLYSAERPKLVKLIKTNGSSWVSKYARGGSARKQSARKFYITIDALQGHFASNGQAPFPRAKMSQLVSNIAETKQLMAVGK